MKTSLVCDIDSTLTPPRQPITKEMVDILGSLNVPFVVAAGTHLSLLMAQFFEPLFQHGYRKQFKAFLSNGAMEYSCDFSKEIDIKLIDEFNLRKYLGESDYNLILKKLEDILENKEFQLPPTLQIVDGRIVDRVSMINFCPIGRKTHEGIEAQNNRKNFVEFDKATGYRNKIINYFNQELASLVKEKKVNITLGGQTSFDIVISGEDKTKPIVKLLDDGFEKVIFIGDALFPGGNDATVSDFIKNWPAKSTCPAQAIQVNSWHETVDVIRKLNFIS